MNKAAFEYINTNFIAKEVKKNINAHLPKRTFYQRLRKYITLGKDDEVTVQELEMFNKEYLMRHKTFQDFIKLEITNLTKSKS